MKAVRGDEAGWGRWVRRGRRLRGKGARAGKAMGRKDISWHFIDCNCGVDLHP